MLSNAVMSVCALARHHRRMFPCPWCLSGLGSSDKGCRWGLKGRWGGEAELGTARIKGEERNVGDNEGNESGKSEKRVQAGRTRKGGTGK